MAAVWLKYRRWLLPPAALLLLYALAGFVLAPWLLGRQVVSLAHEQLGREASVGTVRINPFTLSLHVADFVLRDVDGSELVRFAGLHADLSAAGLFRRAWTFSELSLDAPYLRLVRAADGGLNLLRLLPAAEEAADASAEPGLPRLIVRRLRIGDGVIDASDEVPATPFHTRIGPFSIALDELSTLPGTVGEQRIVVMLESGARLQLDGELGLEPLHAAGRFSLEGPVATLLSRYLQDSLRFSVEHDDTALSAGFVLAGEADGSLSLAVDELEAGIGELRLSAAESPDFLAWSRLQLSGGSLRWPQGNAHAGRLELDGLRLKARRGEDGSIDLLDFFSPVTPPAAIAADGVEPVAAVGAVVETGDGAPADAAGPAMQLQLDAFALRDAAIEFADTLPAGAVAWSLHDLQLDVQDISNAPGARLPVQLQATVGSGGRIGLDGSLVVEPAPAFDARLEVDGFALAQLQPYVAELAHVELRKGVLGLQGRLVSDADESLAFSGNLAIRELDLHDVVGKAPLLAWQEAGFEGLELQADGKALRLMRLRLRQPFARLFINQDQSTNIGELLVEAPAAAQEAPPTAAAGGEPLHLHIGEVLVEGGEVDFTDLSLPLPFAVRIEKFGGKLGTIDSRSRRPARIALEGGVAPYGLAQVDGQLRVNAPTEQTDVGVMFRNIEMATLSPYTVKFAGRKIAAGKLDLDLRYRLDQRRLVGSNKVIIDELELGEKLPSPGAANLPLGLAVALLKDANGRISVDMPVEGSLDDPQFRIGGVLWKAFTTLVARVASAPFRLLGNLLGVESEDLGRIDFAPGRAELLPPARESLARIAEALAQRPGLLLKVPAVAAADADGQALRTARVGAWLEAALAEAEGSSAPASARLERRRRELLEAQYVERFPGRELAELRTAHTLPPADDPAGRPRLDLLAYLEALREELVVAEPIADADLDALAKARMEAVSGELVQALQLPAARVRAGGREEVAVQDGWVPAQIGIGTLAD
ncbi:MAG: DUF748 domain-containing protein [Gammaproteobacteria bacterium]|nr:DUF748 domain-containing protein [Gammaproteobacteria bacterium]